jgi:hypothetical protein
MNLGELLNELRVNILHDRSDRIDGSSDYLWTDATLTNYINVAQRRFARRSLCLRDSKTAEVCQFTLASGQRDYTLHPSVIAVVSAQLEDDTTDLRRGGHSIFSTYQRPDTDVFDVNQLAMLSPDKPFAFSTDETLDEDDYGAISSVVMRMYPTPSAAYDGKKVYLRVIRLPIDRLSNEKQQCEIPEDHQFEMLDWAAYLALRIADHDAGDAPRAENYAKTFEAHAQVARNAAMRKLFAPTTWGFGRNGYTWER